MIPPIYEDSRGPIVMSVDTDTDQCVAHLVVKRTGKIVGKFSYPQRDGYELLAKDGNTYTGNITKAMTLSLDNEVLRLDFAAFVNSNIKAQGKADITRIEDITTKEIEKV